MTPPKVSVLMPVYNGARFLQEAIDSILNQSFRDFEFIIVNDGSTDGSAAIVESCRDERIRLIHNPGNLGLIATLNEGISLAKGEFVARMDCDDVSLPERLAKQVRLLDGDPALALVAVKAVFIDAAGNEDGFWSDDRDYTSYEEIVGRLPRANCIVHPGIMIRKSVLESYRYDSRQRNSEDYDLWLRLAADKKKVAKIDEVLLKYRVTPVSVTAVSNRRHPDFKNVRTKTIFFSTMLGKGTINFFVLRVFLNIFRDLFYCLAKMACGSIGYVPKVKR